MLIDIKGGVGIKEKQIFKEKIIILELKMFVIAIENYAFVLQSWVEWKI